MFSSMDKNLGQGTEKFSRSFFTQARARESNSPITALGASDAISFTENPTSESQPGTKGGNDTVAVIDAKIRQGMKAGQRICVHKENTSPGKSSSARVSHGLKPRNSPRTSRGRFSWNMPLTCSGLFLNRSTLTGRSTISSTGLGGIKQTILRPRSSLNFLG